MQELELFAAVQKAVKGRPWIAGVGYHVNTRLYREFVKEVDAFGGLQSRFSHCSYYNKPS